MKAVIAYRLGMDAWMIDDTDFGRFWKCLTKTRGAIDEVALFINQNHGPERLEVYAERLEVAERRIREIRAMECRVGINNLVTVGHHEENLDKVVRGFRHVRDSQGRVCRGSVCMNDETYLREHVEPLYRMIARTAPEFIWVDDDVRMLGHMPIGETCFCEACMEIFSHRVGQSWTRDALVAAMDAHDAGALSLRRQWLAMNRASIRNVLGTVERAVHEVNPDIVLGMMTGERPYEGYAFQEWEACLSGPAQKPVMWRPGGGFYEESWPAGMPQKAHQIGRQIAYLSPNVERIESEIENHPTYRLNKSARTVGVEAACHIAAGCTGAAYNVLSPSAMLAGYETAEYQKMIDALAEKRHFHDEMVAAMGRRPAVGVHSGWCQDIAVAAGLQQGNWFSSDIYSLAGCHTEWLYMLGLPAAYHPDHAKVFALSGAAARALTDEWLLDCLSRAVYMDGEALGVVVERGMGSFCGMEVVATHVRDTQERFTAHAFNHGQTGRTHDVAQSFYGSASHALRAMAPGVQWVSELVTHSGAEAGHTIGLCVAGYGPWSLSASKTKGDQIKAIFDWLAGGTMGMIESYHKAQLWVRGYADAPAAVLNMAMDDAEGLVVRLPSDKHARRFLAYDGGETALRGTDAGAGTMRYTLPTLRPFGFGLVV
jgi:phosphopantetheine adenylyltransferase